MLGTVFRLSETMQQTAALSTSGCKGKKALQRGGKGKPLRVNVRSCREGGREERGGGRGAKEVEQVWVHAEVKLCQGCTSVA